MGAFVDLVVTIFPPEIAAVVVILALVDVLQVRYLGQRLDRIGGRVERVEDVFIQTDGGTDEDGDGSDR